MIFVKMQSRFMYIIYSLCNSMKHIRDVGIKLLIVFMISSKEKNCVLDDHLQIRRSTTIKYNPHYHSDYICN